MDQAIETSLGSPWTPTGPGPSMQGPGLWVLEDVCWWWASWLLGDHGLCLGLLHFALATSLGRCCSSLGPAGFGGTVSALAFGFVEGGGGCLGGVLGC